MRYDSIRHMRQGLILISVIFLVFFTVFLPTANLTTPDPNEVQIPDEIPCEAPVENRHLQSCLIKFQTKNLFTTSWFIDVPIIWPHRIELVPQFVPLELQRPPTHS